MLALRAATIGLGAQPRVDRVEFATVEAVPFQVDGEIRQLDAAADMVIDCLPHALASVG